MTTEAELVIAIAADYGSDEPRLVYADWLLDKGEELRAELVRLQCALARAEGKPRTPEVNRLFDRRTQLQRPMEALVQAVDLPRWITLRWHRGLMQSIELSASKFPHAAEAILERVPFFMGLRVRREVGDSIADVVDTPALCKVRELDIAAEDSPLDAIELRRVLDAVQPHTLRLGQALAGAAAEILAGHPARHQLRALTVSSLDASGMAALAECDLALEHLCLYRIGGARGAKALLSAKWLASVHLELHKKAIENKKTLELLAERMGDRLRLYPDSYGS